MLALCILAVALLSGCLGIKAPPVSRPVIPAVYVDYQRTGGIAGLNDRLVIFDNGAGLVSGRNINKEITLNQSELDAISRNFNTARFPSLEPSYTSRGGGADLIQYTITFGNKTVTTEDSAIPPRLQPVIDELNQVLRRGLASEPATGFPGNLTP